MSYKIVGDSCCDYTTVENKKDTFIQIPLTLDVDGFQIRDDDTFEQIEFLKRVAVSKECPRSACPAPEEYMKAYEQADDIYVVTLSSELSGSYNSAVLAKNLYEDVGVYIGLSDTNKEQIQRFILDKVIGVEKNADGEYDSTFDITFTSVTTSSNTSNTLTLDREYEQVVENIINYACEQVLIGGTDGDGEVNIDEPFPISEIVDYSGNTFLVQQTDESPVNEFGDLSLEYVPEAQYQCISLELLPDQVGENIYLKDLLLTFQYYNTGTTDQSLTYLDEITINVGINYYNCTENTLTQYSPTRVTIENSNVLTTGDDPDKNLVYFANSEYLEGYDGIIQIDPIPARMSFDNNIDNGVLNARENGEEIEEGVSVIRIDGESQARKYYRMNDSASYGQYATFNPDMFNGKTDYIEIYFDVEKVKGLEDINYNFKVGINWTTTDYWN